MAVHFETVWPVAAGNIAEAEITDRSHAAAASVTTGAAQAFWWSDDGTAGGDALYANNPTECPWPIVVMQSGSGFGITGSFGPIMSPSDSGVASDLYSWRMEWDAVATLWKTTIYAGGIDGELGVGHLDSSGQGRHFFAMQIGGG